MASIKFDTYREQLETVKDLCIRLTKNCQRFAENTTNSPYFDEMTDVIKGLRELNDIVKGS